MNMLELNDYSAKIKNVYVFNINAYFGTQGIDFITDIDNATVDFHYDAKAKQWGIYSLTMVIDKIVAEINWYVDTYELNDQQKDILIKLGGVENRNDTISGTIKIDSTKDKWEIDNEVEIQENGAYLISDLEFDFLRNL